jgi:hypothetical protein
MVEEPTTYCRVDVGDGYYLVEQHEEPRIDAAVSAFLDSGCTRDQLLTIDLLDGKVLKLRASRIESFYISTPDNRRASIEREKALADESKATRASLGMFDE